MSASADGDGPAQYRVLQSPAISVHGLPSIRSRKVCTKSCGEEVTLLEWDKSRRWRKTHVQNQLGETVEGWLQVVNQDQQHLEPIVAASHLGAKLGPQGEMSVEDILAMQRALEERLLAKGVQTTATAPGKDAMASKAGARPSQRDTEEPGDSRPPPRTDKGQLYEVVFPKPVAVREAPSLEAPFFRRLLPGSRVELFEWDRSRTWRRITLSKACDVDNNWKPQADVVVAPDPARGGLGPICQMQSEAITPEQGSLDGFLEEADGWVMIVHPELGQLLRAAPPAWLESPEEPESSGFLQSLMNPQEYEPSLVPPRHPEADSKVSSWVKAPALQPKPLAAAERMSAWEDAWAWAGPAQRWRSMGVMPEVDERVAQLRRAQLLEAEAVGSVEERPGLNEPPIMRATRAGSYEAVRSMLGRGENPSKADRLGETALFEASANGRVDIVALLLLVHADPNQTANSGMTPKDLASDAPTQALLEKWQGLQVADGEVEAALLRMDRRDSHRIAERWGLSVPTTPVPPPLAAEAPKEAPKKPPSAAGAPPDAAEAAPAEQQPLAAVAAAEAASPEKREAPPLRKQETPLARYRVVHKRVAVREFPDTKSRQLRMRRQGDIVDMFEWDATAEWRRVRVEAATGDDNNNKVEEIDGWMLISSDAIGVLLEEVKDEPENDSSDDDDFAG